MPAYKKIKILRTGGQASVWEGVDVERGNPVALKYLTVKGARRPKTSEAEEGKVRFIREVRIQQSLHHPGIMPILGYSGRVNHPWYAMPLAEETFEDCLQGPKRDAAWALEVIHQVIDAVEYSHENGVIHRDLKPSNVLRVGDTWVVSDFGYCIDLNSDSVKLTQPRALLGTWFYAAPEQYDDAHTVGPSADVYSIGKILMYCLSGNPPGPYLRLAEISAPYQEIIRRCSAEEASDRFQTMDELRGALLAVSEHTAR